jgi:pimeloyl-ACP methyl ester carboxylesterase
MSGKSLVWIFMAVAAAAVLEACQTAPVNTPLRPEGPTAIMRQVMERHDKIVRLSSEEIRPDQPVLLLLHGATDDPAEMWPVFTEWRDQYNVFLYSYNYHQPIKKVASDLVREMKALRTEIEGVRPRHGPVEDVTVVTYSYSAIVFRMAVIVADDPTLFSNVSLIQLVPAAGGSSFARSMWFPGVEALVSLASKPSAAVCPYGPLAKELWEDQGTRKFCEAIDPNRTVSLLLEGDTHSLAGAWSKKIQRRYKNGIGANVIVIPKSAGVTHEYFPTERAGLDYLRMALERMRDKAITTGAPPARPDPPRKPLDLVLVPGF